MNAIPSPILSLIDALAEQSAADYLTSQAASRLAEQDGRTYPVPLPAVDKAA